LASRTLLGVRREGLAGAALRGVKLKLMPAGGGGGRGEGGSEGTGV